MISSLSYEHYLVFIIREIKELLMSGFLFFLLSTGRQYHHIWIRLVNRIIPQVRYIYSYDEMIKIIANFGSNKFENNTHPLENSPI